MNPKPLIKFIPAHGSNYETGRRGFNIDTLIMHHMAFEGSAGAYFQNSAANVSSTYGVAHGGKVEQYVSEANTPYTSSNITYDLRAITIEVSGDWRFGYDNPVVWGKTVALVKWIRSRHNISKSRFFRHRQIPGASTLCNGDFFMNKLWEESTPDTEVIEVTPEWSAKYTKIESKEYELKRDTWLWDYSFAKHNQMKKVERDGEPILYRKGHVFTGVAFATHKPTNSIYYKTHFSYDNGRINKTWGFNKADIKVHTDVTPDIVAPPNSCVNNTDLGPEIEDIQEQVDNNTEEISKIREVLRKIWEILSGFFGR